MKIYKTLFFLLLFLVIAGVIGAIWYIFKPSILITSQKPTFTSTPTPVVTQKGVGLKTIEPQVDDSELIKVAMAQKHNKNVSEVNLTITKIEGKYANGGVSFVGEVGGGWFLAFKDAGDWKIVADGNGTMMCADVKPYNFPKSMVPECWDEATSKLIKL